MKFKCPICDHVSDNGDWKGSAKGRIKYEYGYDEGEILNSAVSFWQDKEWYVCPCCGNMVYGKGRIQVDGEQPKVYVIHVEDDERDTSVVKVVRSQKEAEDYVRIHNESPGYSDVMFGNHYFWQAFTVKPKCTYKKPKYVRILSTEPLRYYFTNGIPENSLDDYGKPVITIEYHGLSGEKLEEFIRKTLEKHEKTEETDGLPTEN